MCDFKSVKYNGRYYAVFTIQYKKNDVKFVCDLDDLNKVLDRGWHLSSGKYIGSNQTLEDGTVKELYLHNLIMADVIAAQNSTERLYVTHINKNTLDNRKENLKIVTYNELILNKNKKRRNIILPLNSGIQTKDIPKYVTYMKAYGNHGDRFYIDIPSIHFTYKGTSSSKKTIVEKLNEIKEVMAKVYEEYPNLNPSLNSDIVTQLQLDFSEITRLTDA